MPDDPNQQLPLDPSRGGNIQPINIEEEMRRSYLDYSMSVIIGRALPDVRDGLKPVHRRILYTMQQMGLLPNRKPRASAPASSAKCMGKYHPHGNLAVYDALVRLAQPWRMRYPLVIGQGNFGSVDGDPPAADRYTEAKLDRGRRQRCSKTRQRHRRLSSPTTTTRGRARRSAHAHSESAGERLRRNRRRHGDQNSAAQSHRDRRRLHHAGEQPARHARRHPEVRAGPRLPHRRHHPRPQRESSKPTAPAAAAS